MSTFEKANKIFAKLYSMRKMDFQKINIKDFIKKATPKEIDFYYEKIIGAVYK